MDRIISTCQKMIASSSDITDTEKTILIEKMFDIRGDIVKTDEEYSTVVDKYTKYGEKIDRDAFSPTYKKFNQSDKFLERLWTIFPTFEYNKSKDITSNQLINTLNNFIIDHVRTDSNEFCSLLSAGKIKSRLFAQGGFGSVGDLFMDEDEKNQDVKAVIISLRRNGGFEPFYCPVIIKSALEPTNVTWSGSRMSDGTSIIFVGDPITEMVYGTMLGHFYDMGMCPFYNKYFGMFSCPAGRQETLHFITEKSTVELGAFLSTSKYIKGSQQWIANPTFPKIDKRPDILLNILFQYIYAIYVGKTKIGFTHYDTHHRNVLLTYTDDRLFTTDEMYTEPVDYTYQGKSMKNIKYIVYNTDSVNIDGSNRPVLVVTRYNGLMAKMIDLGSCSAFMNTPSASEYKRPYTLATDPVTLSKIAGATDAYNTTTTNASARNTTELQFLLTCLRENMDKGLVAWTGPPMMYPSAAQSRQENKNLLKTLEDFSSIFYDNAAYGIDTYVRNNASTKGCRMRKDGNGVGESNWHPWPRTRDAGISVPGFGDPKALMIGMARYCHGLGHTKTVDVPFDPRKENGETIGMGQEGSVLYYLEPELGGELDNLTYDNCLILSANPSNYNKRMNSFYKNFKNIDNLANKCSFTIPEQSGGRVTNNIDNSACAKAIDEAIRLQTSTTMEKPLYNPMVNAPGYDSSKGVIKNNIVLSRQNFPGTRRVIDNGKNLRIYSLPINPEALHMKQEGQSSFVYKSYQNWMDYSNITANYDGTYMQTVNLNVITITPKTGHIIKLNHGKSLWDANKELTDYPTAITVNGGYFIVGANINKLTAGIVDNRDGYKPIGFCYDNYRTENGTYLPVPKPYRPYFGVISCKNNKISIQYHKTFIKKHKTIDQVIKYELEDGTVYSTKQPVIQMDTGKAKGRTPVLKKSGDDYDWAFCSGPMLVFDGKVVFNFDTMFTKQFTIDDSDKPAVSGVVKPPNNTTYKLLPKAPNNFMFKGGPQGDGHTAYGSRHSNRMMIHNVMGITKEGVVMCFMIEGRGYDAPGLDRVQVANLVNKFNIETAISLDGGFSANAVYKTDGGYQKWLQNDPEKRDLGISISFAFTG